MSTATTAAVAGPDDDLEVEHLLDEPVEAHEADDLGGVEVDDPHTGVARVVDAREVLGHP